MGNCCCHKNKKKRKIVLLLVGLDNAGKTAAAKGLAGEPLDTIVPTVGFSIITLKYHGYVVQVFDLGGGNNIRGIWERYFVDAYGVIFVVDSSDYDRLSEVKSVLSDLVVHKKISGKPILLLANKQDHQDALDELDLVESLNLEELVNKAQCPTLVETCSAHQMQSKSKLDPGIKKGYRWLLNYIIRHYKDISARVESDVKNQELEEKAERLRKLESLKKEYERYKTESNIYAIEPYAEYSKKMNGHVENNVEEKAPREQTEILVIRNTNDYDNSSDSSASDRSLPPIYYGTLNDGDIFEQPKSARQAVKEQLQLEQFQRRSSFKSVFHPRTAPAHIYPRSAPERRKHTFDQRHLKSAGDSIFTISKAVKNEMSGPQGDSVNKNSFELYHFTHKVSSPRIETPKTKLIQVNGYMNPEVWLQDTSLSKLK